MNLPNQLTLARLFLVLPFVIALSIDFPGAKALALVLFILATLTDYLDGLIARRWDLVTDFGKLMDPLVDKIMTVSAFICLVAVGYLPAWAVITIVSREFLITGLRLIAASQGKVLPAERLGKHKTAWQMLTIIFFLALLAVGKLGWVGQDEALTGALTIIGWGLVLVTVLLTIASGASYLAKNWDLVRET
jgi:CDP-diacylglycerol--glycerol-3-phosphate 3-phosphatidyltransferase